MTTAIQQQENKTGLARKASPTDSIGSVGNLKTLLERCSPQINEVIPRHLTVNRMLKLVLVAANRNRDILECTQESIIESVMRAAELGLDCSGTLGEAYIVPFNNRVKVNGQDVWLKQAQLIPGFRGLAKLARQSGEVKRVEAEVVYQHDDFTYRKGRQFELEFTPNLQGDRGDPIGAYALAEMSDGSIQAEFMPVSEIEKIRSMSKAAYNRKGDPIGPWRDHWDEMARKTVWRRLAKWLPLSCEKFDDAVRMSDDEYDTDGPEVVGVEKQALPNGTSKSERILGRLNGDAGETDPIETEAAESEPEAEPEPEPEPEPTEEELTGDDADDEDIEDAADVLMALAREADPDAPEEFVVVAVEAVAKDHKIDLGGSPDQVGAKLKKVNWKMRINAAANAEAKKK